VSATRSVTPRTLQDRLDSLARELSSRGEALALLALGSAGAEAARLDAWSDLDFFVLVSDGAKGRFIGNLDWLAAACPLAWHFQNTADGHKALMTDGVFCEFAVFEIHELSRIPYAPGRFIWRRSGVDEALARPQRPLPARHGHDWLVGEALSNLILGLQRHARGEKLSAMRLIQVHALDRVLEWLELQAPAAQDPRAARDPFSVERRIEWRLAGAAPALPVWAGGYAHTVPAALALLAALEAQGEVPLEVAAHVRMLAGAASCLSTQDAGTGAPASMQRHGPPGADAAAVPPAGAEFILYVEDQDRSTDFYERALGVSPRLRVPGMTEFDLPGGATLGLMPEAGIKKLLGERLPDPERGRGVARAELYLLVDEPGACHARALAAGATELSPLQARSWGHLAAYSLDPDGHVLAWARLEDRPGAADLGAPAARPGRA
jgi:uncharacterized glyoxalase superfamily protein PhnB